MKNRKIAGINDSIAIEIRIRIGRAIARPEDRKIKGTDKARLIQISVAPIAVTVTVGIPLTVPAGIRQQRSVRRIDAIVIRIPNSVTIAVMIDQRQQCAIEVNILL